MTKEDISRMAREAGLIWWTSHQTPLLERFAALISAAEREACAKVCESLFDLEDDSCDEAEKCADAIRARSKT